jgi:hypothetical protein
MPYGHVVVVDFMIYEDNFCVLNIYIQKGLKFSRLPYKTEGQQICLISISRSSTHHLSAKKVQ